MAGQQWAPRDVHVLEKVTESSVQELFALWLNLGHQLRSWELWDALILYQTVVHLANTYEQSNKLFIFLALKGSVSSFSLQAGQLQWSGRDMHIYVYVGVMYMCTYRPILRLLSSVPDHMMETY